MLLEGMAGDISQEQADYIRTIKDKGESLLELIGSLLDMSKIEAGAMRLNISEFDIGEVVDGAQSYVVPQAKKKQIQLTTTRAPPRHHSTGTPDKIRTTLTS